MLSLHAIHENNIEWKQRKQKTGEKSAEFSLMREQIRFFIIHFFYPMDQLLFCIPMHDVFIFLSISPHPLSPLINGFFIPICHTMNAEDDNGIVASLK